MTCKRRLNSYHVSLSLIIAIVTGCAGISKMQMPDKTPATTSQTEKPMPAAANGITGNTLSQWFDRTPTISPSPAWPSVAEDCAMIYDPVKHRIVLFGGKNDDNQNVNDVWAFDLEQNAWQKIAVGGESPPPSEDHVGIYDPIGYRMIVHGGEDGSPWNNTWSFDLAAHRWRDMTDSTAPAREDHTAIFDGHGKRMVIFGGRDYYNDKIYEIRALDLDPGSPTFEKWQNLTVEKKHPEGRYDHVAVFDSLKNRMIIYGGWDKEKKEYLDDTWAFYFAPLDSGETTGYWEKIKAKKSHPPKRRHAVGAYDSARNWFIICGGFGDEGYLNDVWAFDLTNEVWMNITPGPQPRIDHQAIYEPRSGRLILYGGDARLRTKFHDFWELEIQPGVSLDPLRPKAGPMISERQ
jgi:hypothetical protein